MMKNNTILYLGNFKPSVDTPVQLKLYNTFPRMKYALHGHVYVKNAMFTRQIIPCGALEEFSEIFSTIINHTNDVVTSFAINLKGHGFIAMTEDLEFLKRLQNEYFARPIPESHKICNEISSSTGAGTQKVTLRTLYIKKTD